MGLVCGFMSHSTALVMLRRSQFVTMIAADFVSLNFVFSINKEVKIEFVISS